MSCATPSVVPTGFGMEAALTEVRDLCAGFDLFNDKQNADATVFKAFYPDPDIPKKAAFKATYPRIEVEEDTEEKLDGEAPAGIGQIFMRYRMIVTLHGYDYQDAHASRQFCRDAVRNLEILFTLHFNGDPAGTWWNSVLEQPEYVAIKLTREYWGVAARVPVVIEKVFNKDAIRGC